MIALTEPNRRRALVLAMGGLGGLVMLDETVLGVALPAIRSDLGLSATTTHWILNSYMLAFTCLAAVGGKAIDLFGLRPALTVSCVLFATASLIAGFADSASLLIAMRVVQGICAAIIFPMTLSATTLTFKAEERGRAIGILAGTATTFLAAGPLIGGFLTDFLSWRWVFWINIPIVAIGGTLACLFWRPPERDKTPQPDIDRIGLVLLIVGLTTLIFGLMEGPDYGWSRSFIVLSLLAGCVGLTAFVIHETRVDAPLIDVRLFKIHAFSASALVVLLTQMSKITVAIFVPHFLQLELHFTAILAGICTVIAVLPFPVLSAQAGKLSDKYGSRKPVLTSLCLIAAANVGLGAAMLQDNYFYLAPFLLLWGLALPFSMIPVNRITSNAVPNEMQGELSGLIITVRLVGGTLGVTLGSVLLTADVGFPAVFWTMAALLVMVMIYCRIAIQPEQTATSS